MKNLLHLLPVLALVLCPLAAHADPELPKNCLKAYEKSSEPGIVAAREFIGDAQNDFDYPSNDRMSAAIRAKTGLRAWAKPDFQDGLNVAAAYALEEIKDKICGKPVSHDQLRDLLISEGLPKYFKKFPKEAEELGWKK